MSPLCYGQKSPPRGEVTPKEAAQPVSESVSRQVLGNRSGPGQMRPAPGPDTPGRTHRKEPPRCATSVPLRPQTLVAGQACPQSSALCAPGSQLTRCTRSMTRGRRPPRLAQHSSPASRLRSIRKASSPWRSASAEPSRLGVPTSPGSPSSARRRRVRREVIRMWRDPWRSAPPSGRHVPEPRASEFEQRLIAFGLVTTAAAGLLVWLSGQLAGLLFGHTWMHLTVGDVAAILWRLPSTLGDPKLAWPAEVRGNLPGPVGLYFSAALLVGGIAGAITLVVRLATQYLPGRAPGHRPGREHTRRH